MDCQVEQNKAEQYVEHKFYQLKVINKSYQVKTMDIEFPGTHYILVNWPI